MIFKKNYNIKIVTSSSNLLKKSLNDDSKIVYISKIMTENGYNFTSNSFRIGSEYAWRGKSSKYIVKENDFLIDQSLGKSNSDLFLELLQEPKHLNNFTMFYERYFKYLVPVHNKTPVTDFEKYSHILIKRKGSEVITSKQSNFEATEEDELLAAVDAIKPFYENLNNNVELSYKDVLYLSNGFYKFYPKKVTNKNNFTITSNFIKLQSENLIQVKSKYKVKYNDNVLYNFLNYPSNSLEIILDDTLSPLISKDNLDTDNKYIVYKLENNEYIPQFIISSDGTEEQENFNLLLNSHEEFLRPYFILPFKTEVLLSYKDNEQTTEKLILVNTTFEDKKEELSKLIPHINFNI